MRGLWRGATLTLCLAAVACGQQTTAPAAPKTPSPTVSTPVVEPPAPSSDGLFPFRGAITARGTEPFWTVSVDPVAGLQLDTPDAKTKSAPYRAPTQANFGVVMIASRDLTLALRVAACSDGMSDIAYPWEATLTDGAKPMRRGCAYPRWDNDLAGLVGAIDACLAKVGRPAPVVWAIRDDQGARVRLGVGGTRECTVSYSGVVTLAENAVDTPVASERDPIFYRAPMAKPCAAATEAKGPNGVLGWVTKGC